MFSRKGIKSTACCSLGVLKKTHGYNGEYLMTIHDIDPAKIQKLESVFIKVDNLPVPFFIESYKILNEETAYIKFEYIDNINQASEFCGCEVLALKELIGEDDHQRVSLDSLIGFSIIDMKKQPIGTITEIQEIENNPLFIVNNVKQEYLIPVNEEFIVFIDEQTKEIQLDLPEGLLEL